MSRASNQRRDSTSQATSPASHPTTSETCKIDGRFRCLPMQQKLGKSEHHQQRISTHSDLALKLR